jgi:hypothetical protein
MRNMIVSLDYGYFCTRHPLCRLDRSLSRIFRPSMGIPPAGLLHLPARKSYGILNLIKPRMIAIYHQICSTLNANQYKLCINQNVK